MSRLTDNFLGIATESARYDSARFAVLPVPYDATTSFQAGTRLGPDAIIRASQQVEFFDAELQIECHDRGIATLDAVEPNAAGPAAMHEDVFKVARRVVRDGKWLLGLGGEHGISSALVRAVMSRHKKLSVLQVDAHSDLRDTYQGSPFSHACVMRRVVEMGARLVPVGIRNYSAAEHRFMKRAGIMPITPRECQANAGWIERAVAGLGDTVYVTIDIDGFDPAFAPGTGTPEPGGLDWYQVVGLLEAVARQRRIVAADIVEVMPIPGQTVTEFLAAKLAYKLICLVSINDQQA